MSLQSSVSLYQYALAPLPPFSWFGLQTSSLDLAAAFRLCYILRHSRENLRSDHTRQRAADSNLAPVEDRSFVRNALTVLTVVYGGEAIAAPLLGAPCSFMVSGVGPLLYIIAQALVDALPSLPPMASKSELLFSVLDGHTRAMLLCTLLPPVVLGSPFPSVSSSPWSLLLASFIVTNGGFFITNLLSFLHPTPLTLTTPDELKPYGWMTTDLWSAPLVTGIYATLTHAQPFWADLHAVLAGVLGGTGTGTGTGAGKIAPLDPETARSACTLVLVVLFASRAASKAGEAGKRDEAEKIKTN